MTIAMSCALDAWSPLSADQGELDSIRQDVRTPPPPSDSPPPSKHYEDGESPETKDAVGQLWLLPEAACVLAVTSPLWVPIAALHDNYGPPVAFARFPYDNVEGYLLVGPAPVDLKDLADQPANADTSSSAAEKESAVLAPEGSCFAGRLSLDYADNLDRLGQTGGDLLLSTAWRFGMDTQWHYFNEQLPGRASDHLWIGDWNLVFRFAQSEHVEFRTGFGFNWLNDPLDTNFGFNWTYGADFFPIKPWVFSTSIDLGRLGDAGLFHGRATVGVILDRFEVYTGYDYYDIGHVDISSLVGGVRVWF